MALAKWYDAQTQVWVPFYAPNISLSYDDLDVRYPRREEVPSLEEITFSVIAVWRDPATDTPTLNAIDTGEIPLWIAPFPGRILSLHMSIRTDCAASSTNYWRIHFQKTITAGTSEPDLVWQDQTNGWISRAPFEVTNLDEVNRELEYHETLFLEMHKVGTPPTAGGPVLITGRYARA